MTPLPAILAITALGILTLAAAVALAESAPEIDDTDEAGA